MIGKPNLSPSYVRSRLVLPLVLWMGIKAAEGQLDQQTAREMTTGFPEGMATFEKVEIPTGTLPWQQVSTFYSSRAVSGGSPLDALKRP